MSLKLRRQDCEGSEQSEPIVLGAGKHVLGRGLPLKVGLLFTRNVHCTTRNISCTYLCFELFNLIVS